MIALTNPDIGWPLSRHLVAVAEAVAGGVVLVRNTLLGLVSFLVIGCAVKSPSQNWPAKIVSFQNFTSDQQAQLLGFTSDMNQMSSQSLIQQTGNTNGYPVSISLVPPPTDNPLRAGYTTRQSSTCTIQLSNFLFDDSQDSQYLESVFIHEFGHCAGLVHVADPNAVMYPTASAYTSYSQGELESFYQSFTSSMRGGGSTSGGLADLFPLAAFGFRTF